MHKIIPRKCIELSTVGLAPARPSYSVQGLVAKVKDTVAIKNGYFG